MLSKYSIRSKIIVVVSILLVGLTVVGLTGLRQINTITGHLAELQTNWLAAIRSLGEMRTQAARYRVNLRDHLLAADTKGKQEADRNIEVRLKDFEKAWKAYENTVTLPEERALVDTYIKAWQAFRASADKMLEMSRKGDSAAAQEFNLMTSAPLGRGAEEAMRKLTEFNDKGAAGESARATAASQSAFVWIIGMLITTLILGAGAAFYLVRDVSSGIRSIVTPMQALGQGDLTAIVPHQGEKTEIGQMADTLQVFKEALIAKRAADEAAAADAEAKIARGQRVDSITRDFERMIGELVNSLSSSSTELEAAANTLTSTAEATGKISSEAASASQEVSGNVQSVATATEEITSSVNEISRQVQEASRVASDAVKQAAKTDTSIAELSQSAARIGDVVKLINAVAEQTNLLALNATIEAARAGDAGRGFAVVASEVKALAAQTSKATEEIGTQIAGMQSATEASVTAIKEISSTITLISEISSTIAAAVEEQGAATQEIARNVQHAAQRSTAVAENINDVSRGAGETGSASSQVLSSAQTLSSESNRLKMEVENFLTSVRAA
jgi:methyl-accepting chemotaxis protein